MPTTTVASARKRKQPEDIDESPPKRVTRARAAKSATAEPAKTASTKKITTPSARAAAAPKATAKATRAPAKKATKAEEPKDDDVDMLDGAGAPAVKKTRGRPAKEGSEKKAEPKATRTRQTKAVEKDTAKPATRTRTRTASVSEDQNSVAEPVKKSARAATKSSTAKKENTTTKKAAAKKVSFEDDTDQDKENKPLATKSKKEPAKGTGMRAKPVRKAATVKAAATKTGASKTAARSTRAKKATTADTENEDSNAPLSPKKVRQVAKSVSSGSEDELCDRGPIRALSKSPVKVPPTLRSPVKGTQTESVEQPTSPNSPCKSNDAPLLLSPAKRPPPSPFKDAIRVSPKKIALPTANAALDMPSGQSPFKDTLKASPRKLPVTGTSESGLAVPKSPLKASLLKSPAKRPASPEKANLFKSPSKAVQIRETPAGEENTFKLPNITPKRLFLSPRSEVNITPAANHVALPLEAELNEPAFIKGTPAKVAFAKYRENPLAAYEAQHKPAAVPLDSEIQQDNQISDSEDELLSGTPTLAAFGSDTPGPKTPTAGRRETLGITPLALKLSTWYPTGDAEVESTQEEAEKSTTASSPETSESSVIHNKSASVAKPGFFEDELLVTEQEPALAELTSEIVDAVDDVANEAMLDDDVDVLDANFAEAEVCHLESNHTFQETVSTTKDVPGTTESNYTSQGTIVVLEDSPALPEEEPVELDDQDLEFMDEVSQASIDLDFGDENAVPIDPRLFESGLQFTTEPTLSAQNNESSTSGEETAMQTGQVTATPVRAFYSRPREVHTVSKVPLRAEGAESSPIKLPRKRSKSINTPHSDLFQGPRPSPLRHNTVISYSPEEEHVEDADFVTFNAPAETPAKSPRKVSYETSVINAMLTPKPGEAGFISPVKSVRRGADARILKGATVHVDVHTGEGADASSIFVELLTQMGARCVKQWTWNSRASATAADDNTPGNKVGITHVVFKDGSKRTLQKVREAKGQVLCVGVGWVLDCESENQWLDEARYAVDTSTIPRGGHNRRKSMEPKALSNHNGSVKSAETPAKAAGYAITSPDNRFSFGASSRRDSIRVSVGSEDLPEASEGDGVEETEDDSKYAILNQPATPLGFGERVETGAFGSPTTPYFLSKGAQLVQQTCPPKQTMERLFPVSGAIEDQPDESVRQRLLMARRKSLQWAPKVGSPLGRAVSYGRR